jgi:plasmid replication initiation protein
MTGQLKPLKYPQGDLFVCDVTDVILKDDMASMEHPFYSLSKKPDREVRRYEHNGKWIEFRPSIKGLPTIYDKDLIIYAISHLVAGVEDGEEIPKTVEIDPYSFFLFTQRGTGGRDYKALCDSLDRIDGTRYRTNVLFNGTKTDVWMGIIDQAALETDEKTNRPRKLRITLSDMIIKALKQRKNVLTLHRDYFRLRKPIQRRVYELARKHCGNQAEWRPYVKTLKVKSGSQASLREFRRAIKELVEEQALPDYAIAFDEENDQVIFTNKMNLRRDKDSGEDHAFPTLDPETYQHARSVAPGYDVYYLEREWREWWADSGKPPLKNPGMAFIAFCKRRYQNNPNP